MFKSMVPKILIITSTILISCGFGHVLQTTTPLFRENDETRIPSSHLEETSQKGNISIEPRIYGGEKASIKDFPWMASVCRVKSNKEGIFLSFSGAASLITKRHLLTAAHLLRHHTKNPKEIEISIGSEYKCRGIHFYINKVHVHPKYNHHNFHNDIGVIELVTTIDFTDVIKPIKLPKGFENYEGRMLTTIGWGYTSNKSKTDVLMRVEILIHSEKTCKKIFPDFLAKEDICGGGSQNGTCKGDSGGPLMVKNGEDFTIVGLTSFSRKGPCRNPFPKYFTNVATYLDWIHEKTS